jgi:hypothetical protein
VWINGPREYPWRGVFVVLAILVVGTSRDANMFGLVPILLWAALARSWRTGVVVALVLLALLTWFVVPRGLGWSGPWVPSSLEVYWLYPLIAAVVCEAGVLVERRSPAGLGLLIPMVGLGFLAAVLDVVWVHGSKPGSEGVLPEPPAIEIVEGAGHCGSGNCAREVEATGDRAPEVMRAHLASRGFSPSPPLDSDERLCRVIGLAVRHEVCAELRDTGANSVRVLWYVNRNAW